MRELPEFQVLANHLNSYFKGKILLDLKVNNTKKLKDIQVELDKCLKGNILKSVYRYGKELHFQFVNNVVLGMNLMLHGNIQSFGKVNENKFTIVELVFNKGKGLALTDWQGNATIKLNPEENCGIDALSEELYDYLLSTLQNKAKIKAMITNEKVIRGIGNVYADEILWEAKISPFSVASAIPEFKIKALANAVRKVLLDAEKQLTSKKMVLLPSEPHDFLKIYGKEGESSPNGSIIKVNKIARHCTYYTDEQELYK